MIASRSIEGDFDTVYAFSTRFYPKLLKSGYKSVKRWTKNVDIFEYGIIFVPVHLGSHWCLATIDTKEKSVNYYDSNQGRNMACLDVLENYIQAEYIEKRTVRTFIDSCHS